MESNREDKKSKSNFLQCLQRVKSQRCRVLNPEKIRETVIWKEIYEKADSAVSVDIVECVDALKNANCRELSDLSSKLEAEATKYKNLQEALKLKEAELKQIYDIDAAASSLPALIEAHRMKQEEFEVAEAKWASDFVTKKLDTEVHFAQEAADVEKKRNVSRKNMIITGNVNVSVRKLYSKMNCLD